MMITLLFWFGVALVFYTYLGYGIILGILVKVKRIFLGKQQLASPTDWPEVTFTVCAFNEEEWMASKVQNCLDFDYPREKITLFFVTDGSSDGTPKVVENFPFPPGARWKLLHSPERRGKIAAFHRSMAFVETPIVISTDANTVVNPQAIKNIVRHFEEKNVGAVAGEKRIFMSEANAANAAGEGVYWKYESLLKRWDSELYSVVGAAGELFAIRTELYEAVPTDTIIEDFYLTLRIAQRGFQVRYEPDAFAAETASANVAEETKRKVRIAAGGLQAISRLLPLLNPFRYGTLSFQYISHRVLRWTLAPLFLPVIFITNLILAIQGNTLYQIIFALQVLFYAAALVGWLLEQKKIKVKALFIPYYFCVMNFSVYAGFNRFVRGSQSVLWERAKRST